VWFPPQHLLEQAFAETSGGTARLNVEVEVEARWCAPTRLVFSIPKVFETEPLPLELATLLDWDRLIPSLAPHALPPNFRVTTQ